MLKKVFWKKSQSYVSKHLQGCVVGRLLCFCEFVSDSLHRQAEFVILSHCLVQNEELDVTMEVKS